MYLPSGLSIDAADKPVVQLAYRNCTSGRLLVSAEIGRPHDRGVFQGSRWNRARADDEWAEGQHQILAERIVGGFGCFAED